eukprot:TRINITY_DN901_c0_g1_i3.p2 TRINITY_DN901_c0_g1~~TRINITY_DN901_c0_g1_i3.p2  ORF type:complete len:324 (-),score=-10.67 TRINITY_DN901_c0_g1_i3:567-1538(-)
MARVTLIALLLVVLATTGPSAFAQPGGGGRGGRGGGGPRGPHGPPPELLAANVTGNLTGLVGAALANCSGDNAGSLGRFLVAIFVDDSSGSAAYSLFYSAELRYNGTAPDSLAVVQGAACDAAATAVLPLPAANWTTETHDRPDGTTVTELAISGVVENADATVVEAILAGVPNATVGANATGGLFNRARQGAAAAAGRLTGGRKLLAVVGTGVSSAGKTAARNFAAKQKARAAWLKAKAQAALKRLQTGATGSAATSDYAVLAADSTTGLSWGAALTALPAAGPGGGGGGCDGDGGRGGGAGAGGQGPRGGRGGQGGGGGGY